MYLFLGAWFRRQRDFVLYQYTDLPQDIYIDEVVFSRATILYVYTDFLGLIFNLCPVVYNIDMQDHGDGGSATDARSGSIDWSFPS